MSPTIESGRSTTPTVRVLTSLRPALVVVQGTRIIARPVLESGGLPRHQPARRYHPALPGGARGIRGAGGAHPEWIGTTVHLVDPGIDTGGILAQTVFQVTGQDSFATYPDTASGARASPCWAREVDKVMAGPTPSRARRAWRPARAATTTEHSGATFGGVGAREVWVRRVRPLPI